MLRQRRRSQPRRNPTLCGSGPRRWMSARWRSGGRRHRSGVRRAAAQALEPSLAGRRLRRLDAHDSPEAVTLLQSIEALGLQPNDDQTGAETANRWRCHVRLRSSSSSRTMGERQGGITEAQADALFRADASLTNARRPGRRVGSEQFESSPRRSCLNIGKAGFAIRPVVRVRERFGGDHRPRLARGGMEVVESVEGKVMKGLTRRNAAEWRIYTSAIYARWSASLPSPLARAGSLVLLVGAAGAATINNPDSPDRVGAFERRAAIRGAARGDGRRQRRQPCRPCLPSFLDAG